MDLRNMRLDIQIEIADGGFIVHTPVIVKNDKGEETVIYRRCVVTSPRKALALVKDAMNEFKLSDTDEE